MKKRKMRIYVQEKNENKKKTIDKNKNKNRCARISSREEEKRAEITVGGIKKRKKWRICDV